MRTAHVTSRHDCALRLTPGSGHRHTHGEGRPTRKRCVCGGELVTHTGIWGVFVWTGRGDYRLPDALATFRRGAQASAYADAHVTPDHGHGGLVVRWVSA